MRPVRRAVARRPVIGEAVNVMDVCTDAAVAQLIQPAVVALQAETVEHLRVTNVQPEARDLRRIIVEQFPQFARPGELVVVITVFEANGHIAGSRIFGNLGQRTAGQREIGTRRLRAPLDRPSAQYIDFSPIALPGVVALSKLTLLPKHAALDSSQVHNHITRAAACCMIDCNAGALNSKDTLFFVGRREVESVR